MSSQRCTPECKDEAVRQIIDRGYSVAEVSKRLGVSTIPVEDQISLPYQEFFIALEKGIFLTAQKID